MMQIEHKDRRPLSAHIVARIARICREHHVVHELDESEVTYNIRGSQRALDAVAGEIAMYLPLLVVIGKDTGDTYTREDESKLRQFAEQIRQLRAQVTAFEKVFPFSEHEVRRVQTEVKLLLEELRLHNLVNE